MIIAADIGNTRLKLGLFVQDDLQDHLVFAHADMPGALLAHPRWPEIKANAQYLGLSSVGKDMMARNLLDAFAWLRPEQVIQITHQTPMPIGNAYRTPETLGIDRLCVAVAAQASSPGMPVLAIDAGTAITYDFVDAQGNYQGGGIAPGMRMRFRALHEFTSRLPLVEPTGLPDLIGRDTADSIRSGVVLGMLAEVDGVIEKYRQMAGNALQVTLTGGDTPFLRNHLKNLNFADANLLLRGIHLLIRYNVQVP